MTNIMDFPDEILQAIADMVDPVSRLRLWRVNRRFRNITKMDKASSRKYWKRVELNGRIRRLNSFERAEIEFMRGMSIIEYVNDAYPYSGGYGGYNHRQKNLVLKSIRRFPEELTAYVKEKATPDFIEWLRDSLTGSSPDSLISLKEVHDETYDIIDMLKSTRVYEDLEEAHRLELFLLTVLLRIC